MNPYLTTRTVGDTLPLLNDLRMIVTAGACVLIITLGIILAAHVAREDQ